MRASLGHASGAMTAAAIAAESQRALDARLTFDAELTVRWPTDRATFVGAFQRRAASDASPAFARGSGGANVRLAPGILCVRLSLARSSVLTPCEPDKVINRYVRPLLRALTKMGVHAHYFGRDWISATQRPVAFVGFAHDASSGRAALEALVGVTTPFAEGPRASFRGASPTTLSECRGRELANEDVAARIADEYASAYACDLRHLDPPRDGASELPQGPPWQATSQEEIGEISAGNDDGGLFQLGGDFMASRDAVLEVSRRSSTARDANEIGSIVNDVFTRPGVVLFGVPRLGVIQDVLARARGLTI